MYIPITYFVLLQTFLLGLLLLIIYLVKKKKERKKDHHKKVEIAQQHLIKKDIELIKNKLLLEEYNQHVKFCITLIEKHQDIDKFQLNKLKKQLVKIYNLKHPLITTKKNSANHPENNLSYLIKKNYPSLTDKEIDVCMYAIAGLSSKEIAIQLDLRTQTVNNYRRSIRAKLKIERKKTLGKTLKELIITN